MFCFERKCNLTKYEIYETKQIECLRNERNYIRLRELIITKKVMNMFIF